MSSETTSKSDATVVPKSGDKVRVTYEGTAGPGGQVVTPYGLTWPHTHGGKVEVIESADDPSKDPIGTVRVHPDDVASDVSARRFIRTHHGTWWSFSGELICARRHSDVRGWPKQPLAEVARVFGHEDAQPVKLRVFKDRDGLTWHEAESESGVFRLGPRAARNHMPGEASRQTHAWLERRHGPLTEVTE